MDFLTTNLNDIIAYALIVVNGILYIVNQHMTKRSGTNLRTSLSKFTLDRLEEHTVRLKESLEKQSQHTSDRIAELNQSTQEFVESHADMFNKAFKEFNDNTLREIHENLNAQRRLIQDIEKRTKEDVQRASDLIVEQRETIAKLRADLKKTSNILQEVSIQVAEISPEQQYPSRSKQIKNTLF